MLKQVILGAMLTLLQVGTFACAQDDVSQKLIERLEKDNARLADENESLKSKIAELEAKLKSLSKEDEPTKNNDKKDPVQIDRVWKGKLVNQKGEGAGITFTVQSKDGNKFTFLSNEERGARWEYDCVLTTATKFKLVDVRRLQANAGITNPPPVGAIAGGGSFNGKKLAFDMNWQSAGLKMRFEGELQDAAK